MMMPQIDELRRELRLRMRHAFGHSYTGHGDRFEHHEANVEGFLRELEAFIDAKITEAMQRETTRQGLKPGRRGATS